jgi:hypothetical protein
MFSVNILLCVCVYFWVSIIIIFLNLYFFYCALCVRTYPVRLNVNTGLRMNSLACVRP